MPNFIYNSYLRHMLSGTIDLVTDSIYVALVSGSYNATLGQTGHSSYANISSTEVTDPLNSYKAGGQLLASKTITLNGNNAVFDAADVTWNTATITQASGAVLYVSGAGSTPSQRHLISYIDLGVQSSTNGTFSIIWNNGGNGIFRVYGA